jgi:DNA-binding transcriptional LysR family regulator
MDRLGAMGVFVAVADAGSLSAGGRSLRMPLATVSRKISELEAHIGSRLFSRTGRRLTLTDAGHAYAEACRRILEEVQDAERTAAGEYASPQGTLAISAPIVFGRLHVLPVVLDFLATVPAIDVRLMLTDRPVDLLEEPIDLAVRIGLPSAQHLVATRIGEVTLLTCASPAYCARRGTPHSPADIATHDCIAFSAVTAEDRWSFGPPGEPTTVPIRPRLSVSTSEAAVDAALSGLGITRLLSYQATDTLRAGRLMRILEAFEPDASPVHLTYPGERRRTLKMRSFLEFATPRLKARLADDDAAVRATTSGHRSSPVIEHTEARA